jgi:hypothetical protein
MIDKLDKLGINLVYSSSSSGRFSFAARDKLTTDRIAYANARPILNALPFTDLETLTPFTPDTVKVVGFLPKPGGRHYIFFNFPGALLFDIYTDVVYGINMEVSPSLLRINSGHPIGIKEKSVAVILKLFQKNLIWRISKKMKEAEQLDKTSVIFMPPEAFVLYMDKMEKKNITYDFSERSDGNIKGIAVTAGGWKTSGMYVDPAEFRERIEYNFNIDQSLIRDWYGMTETNVTALECEKHYKHIPYFAKIFTVDSDGNPLPYGERGRICILDPLGNSYPSFIITGDQGTVLEKCPKCGRFGNVLDNISRMKGETPKGCSEALIRLAGARK